MPRVLTPSGYRDIADCQVGDAVSAFDMVTGAPITNYIEKIQWVDASEWARWWQVEPTTPPFKFYKINGSWVLNSEQSIWRNDNNVCHARDLVPGDIIFDDTDNNTIIISVEEVTATGWWRFDISGDHSYIVDGLTLHNASRFWVGGTASWTAINTTPWAASTGGAGGQTVPGSSDTVTFDGSSGGGTVTVNFGGTITIQTLTFGAFTGTLDFATNNNSITLSAGAGVSGTGSGARTLNMGNGTWTITGSGVGSPWDYTTTTSLTHNCNSSTLVFAFGTLSGGKTFTTGAKTFNIVSWSVTSHAGFQCTIAGGPTIATLNLTAPLKMNFTSGSTVTITNAFNWAGTAYNAAFLLNGLSSGSAATISVASGSPTIAWAALCDLTFSGGATFTATNSLDIGHNSGITITGPSGAFIAQSPRIVSRGTPY